MSVAQPNILVIHGPNLNLLGFREPNLYGVKPLDEVNAEIERKATELGMTLKIMQSNHEGALIDALQENRSWADGIVINAGGLSHTSVSLRDALTALRLPVVEVHVTNIHAREEFRRHSFIAEVAQGQICGLGTYGYVLALLGMKSILGEAI